MSSHGHAGDARIKPPPMCPSQVKYATVMLGYYRGARVGTWVARYRPVGGEGNGLKKALGAADDTAAANGTTVLDWKQALDKATEWFKQQEAGGDAVDPDMTVEDAVDAFITMRDERQAARVGRPARSTASSTLGLHVLPDKVLTQIRLRDLTEANLRSWQRRFPDIRGSTKLRIVSELKAALNATFKENRKVLP